MKIKLSLFFLSLIILTALFIGNVQPSPAQLEDVSNYNGVHIVNSSFGTATPALMVDQQGSTGNVIFEVRDAATPVIRVPNGGGLSLLDGNLTVADYNIVSAQTSITLTDAGVLTPTGSYQPITAAGNVTVTLAACSTAGAYYTFINAANVTITITDTGNAVLSGNAALGQYDALQMLCDGTRMIQIAPESDN